MPQALFECFVLLVAFQIKHFLCDYPLQTRFMLGKFNPWPTFLLPLALHGLVHWVGTFVIAVVATGSFAGAAYMACFDFYVHVVVDRVKASPQLGGRYNTSQPKFWWCLGADQMAHHLTHYAIIYQILKLG